MNLPTASVGEQRTAVEPTPQLTTSTLQCGHIFCLVNPGINVEAKINWQDGVRFSATSGSGHSLTLDGSPDAGGENAGMRPMEAVLIGLGACSAFDVVTILQKSRVQLARCDVALTAERADAIPAVFTRIHLHYQVSGEKLRESQVARAVELSATKYCSATAMLEKTAEVTFDYEVV